MDSRDGARFFFIHVMKTGGAAFRRNARLNCEANEIYPEPETDVNTWDANTSVDYLLNLPAERRQRIKVFCGHFPFVVAGLFDPSLITITLLRDTVGRTVSYLRQVKHLNPRARDSSLEEIYEDPSHHAMLIRNHQVKQFALSLDDGRTSFLRVIEIDDARLELAKRNLESVDVIGLQERSNELLAEMRARYGWRTRPFRANHGVPERTADIPRSFRRRIEDDNAADVAFYEHARRLYGRRRRQAIEYSR